MTKQTSDLIKPVDLQEWIQQYGTYWSVDWKKWEIEYQKMQEARPEGLPKLVVKA